MAIDATLSGINSNCYITLIEAQSIMRNRFSLNRDLEALSEPDLESLLILSTQDLDILKYIGAKTISNQALAWPRIADPALPMVVPPTGIPSLLKFALIEQCRFTLRSQQDIERDGNTASVKIGEFSRTFHKPTIGNDGGVAPKAVGILSSLFLTNQQPTGLLQFPLLYQ